MSCPCKGQSLCWRAAATPCHRTGKERQLKLQDRGSDLVGVFALRAPSDPHGQLPSVSFLLPSRRVGRAEPGAEPEYQRAVFVPSLLGEGLGRPAWLRPCPRAAGAHRRRATHCLAFGSQTVKAGLCFSLSSPTFISQNCSLAGRRKNMLLVWITKMAYSIKSEC